MFSLVAVLLDIKLTFMQGGAGHMHQKLYSQPRVPS